MVEYNKPDMTRASQKIQRYVETLETRIRSLEENLDEVSDQNPGSNVRVGNYGINPDITLPSNSEIDFYLDSPPGERFRGNVISIRHERQHKSKILNVSSSHATLVVVPVALNSLRLRMEDW